MPTDAADPRLDLAVRLARASRTVAVVGLSPDPDRDSHSIARYLKDRGLAIVGVNPRCAEALGARCHASLAAIPEDVRRTIDLVLVFRRPDAVPALLDECAALALRRVWLQPGASSPEAAARARALGLELVAGQCIRVVHSLHAARAARRP
jgi:hypothetical protein